MSGSKRDTVNEQTPVVIIGAGFGGLYVAKCLGGSSRQVVLIDRTNHHLFQPLLYQVATAALASSDIAVPIRQALKGMDNIEVVMGEVTAIERSTRTVRLADGRTFQFGYLVVAVGSEPGYFGNSEWQQNSHGLKTLEDAFSIKERVLMSYERAEANAESRADVEHDLTFAIIGGGPTGVELAGAIVDIASRTLVNEFKHIDPSQTRIYLVEGSDRLLANFPEALSRKAEDYLKKLGVKVLTNHRVTDVQKAGVKAGELFIKTANIFWTAGTQAPELLQTLDVPLDRMGRVEVGPDLTIPGEERVFVIGDAAMAKDAAGNLLPGLAPVAMQQAGYVGRIIRKDIPKEQRQPFRYKDKGILAAVGKRFAVAHLWHMQFSGFFAWLLWSFVHIWKLIFFRSKVMVFFNWAYYYFTGQRGSRIIATKDHDRCA